jgi:hypothetical protein
MFELHKNSKYLEKDDKIVIDATLNINDLIIDWSKSKIDKHYFIDRFEKSKIVNDKWATILFDVDSDNKCLGVDDKRRTAIRKYASSCDNFIYLDNDMFYPNTTLKYMIESAKIIEKEKDYYIISPQSTMLWDASWDVLVNESYRHLKHEDLYCTDQFEVFTRDYGDIEVVPIDTFKMGGGWFNMLSSKLLAYTDIPDSFGPYGLDDTFVVDACKIMKNFNMNIQQYIVKNLVVTQSYMFELHHVYLNHISFNLYKNKEFAANAAKSYQQEIIKFSEKCKSQHIING